MEDIVITKEFILTNLEAIKHGEILCLKEGVRDTYISFKPDDESYASIIVHANNETLYAYGSDSLEPFNVISNIACKHSRTMFENMTWDNLDKTTRDKIISNL